MRHGESGIEILADPAGLRDLARWRLVLADEQAPDGTHVHLEPGTEPLATSALVAHQLPWRHRLASGWAYLIGQRGSAR